MIKEFPENRYKHCYNVGLKMYQYAKENLKWSEKKSREMFVLGNLHDIGYEFEDGHFGHEYALANCLDSVVMPYKYCNEIKYHSKLQFQYQSLELDLLYFADMTVDGFGNWCTFDDRLKDLTERYGKESEVVNTSEKIADYLKSKGFDDKL